MRGSGYGEGRQWWGGDEVVVGVARWLGGGGEG